MNKKLEKMCLKLLFKGKFSNGKIKEKISSKLFEDKIVTDETYIWNRIRESCH